MKRLYQLFAACITAGVIMSSCSGGGSSSSPAPSALAPAGLATASPIPLSHTTYGTATLAIKLPTVFVGKNGTAVVRRTGAASSNRAPAYVNPAVNAILDIYINGSLALSPSVQASGNSVQSISVPLYSQQQDYIDVFEWSSSARTSLLAIGEAQVASFTAGTAVNATLTMLMNASSIGVLDLYNQADPAVMSGQTYTGLAGACGQPASESQLGFYTADATGTFVAAAGYGGTSIPTISATPLPGSTSTLAQSSIAGIYQVAWDGNCGGLTINATATNPASPLATAAETFDAGNSTYSYYYCGIYGGGYCPGGPYQGMWNFYFYYYTGYPNLENYVNKASAPNVSGTITIPSPSPTATAS